jgi:hypothetical protein
VASVTALISLWRPRSRPRRGTSAQLAGALCPTPLRLPLRASDGFGQLGAQLGRRFQKPQKHRVHALLNLAVVASLVAHAGEDNMAAKEPKLASKSALETAFKGLKRVSRVFDFQKSLADMMAGVQDDNDRVTAIVSGSHVENALGSALKARMRPLNISEENELFGIGSPLGTFANKIKIGYGLRLFELATKNDLNIIRKIRNAFAHARDSVNFTRRKFKNVLHYCRFSTCIPSCSIMMTPKSVSSYRAI